MGQACGRRLARGPPSKSLSSAGAHGHLPPAPAGGRPGWGAGEADEPEAWRLGDDPHERARHPRGVLGAEDLGVVDEAKLEHLAARLGAAAEQLEQDRPGVAEVAAHVGGEARERGPLATREKPELLVDAPERPHVRRLVALGSPRPFGRPVARTVVDRVGRRDDGQALREPRHLVHAGQIRTLADEERVARHDARRFPALARRCEREHRREVVERELVRAEGIAPVVHPAERLQRRRVAGLRAPHLVGVLLASAVQDAQRQHLVRARLHDGPRDGRREVPGDGHPRVREDEGAARRQLQLGRPLQPLPEPDLAEGRALARVEDLPLGRRLHRRMVTRYEGLCRGPALFSCSPRSSSPARASLPRRRFPLLRRPSRPRRRLSRLPSLRRCVCPSLARPRRYDLELWLNPRTPTFHGTIGIDLDVLQPTTLLWLNATDLGVDDAKLETPAGAQVARVVPGGSDFVGFVFDREVPPGKARLTIAYHGAVDEERSRAIYAAREGDGEPYIYTFFEPIDARRAFPCFDEPSYKVPWKLSLHVPKGDVALANAPVVAEHDEPGAKLVEMAESKPLPSYLVAFVVGPFDVLEASTAGHSGTPLRFIVPKGRGAETAYAAGITPKIIGALEDYFGMPYPYGKLDVAVVPRFWGTMEHPGIVALGQPLTLIRPSELGVEREQLYTDIAAHELAHYWFGDYVTTAWWDDTWLNEALGEWMNAKVTETLEPGWRFDLERLDRTAYGMRGDALTTAKNIRQPVESKDDIQSSFDAAITYEKGQAVLSMFEAWMTPPRFQHAIRAYMASHAWKNATAEDFFAALDAEQPGAGDAMKTFVEQPGFPSITLEAKCSGANVALDVHQRRYRPLGAEVQAEAWKIPVCVRYPKERAAGGTGRACTLLSTETATIPLETRTCPAWILGNADGAGYYEVAYTPAQLRGALSRSASATTVERLAALRDAAALVASGDLPLADALALAKDTAESRERQVVQRGSTSSTWRGARR